MKQIFICAFLIFLVLTIKGNAQDIVQDRLNQRNKIIKINTLSLRLLNTLNLAYQKVSSPNSATQIRLIGSYIKLDEFTSISGYGISLEQYFYLKDKAPTGFYIAPSLRYKKYKEQGSNYSYNHNVYSGGVMIGYQWVFFNRFAMDIYVGPTYNHWETQEQIASNLPREYEPRRHWWFRSSINLGYVFK